MNDNFWNDERVKEFVNWFNKLSIDEVYKTDRIEQFKQSKQNSNRDWEIAHSRYHAEDSVKTILSVRRISDNEVFSVGDKIKTQYDGIVVLERFNVTKEYLDVTTDKGNMAFKFLDKAKQKLFTTEDGKDIYEGGNVWAVGNVFQVGEVPDVSKSWYDQSRRFFKGLFSTEAAAKDYILMHKPCLSLGDLLSAWGDGYGKPKEYYESAPLFLNFKELANKKINDSNR